MSTMKGLFLIFLLTCGIVVTAQDSKATQAVAGCYELETEGWRGWLFRFPGPPRRFELTEDFEAKDLDTKQRWVLASFWRVTDKGKVVIAWSTGFVGWSILLSKSGTDLRGTADYYTDIDSGTTRHPEPVVAHPVDCKALAKRSRLDWEPFTPLFGILMVMFVALLFAARRSKNKLLRVFLFRIPTLMVSVAVFFIAIVLLFIYLFTRFP